MIKPFSTVTSLQRTQNTAHFGKRSENASFFSPPHPSFPEWIFVYYIIRSDISFLGIFPLHGKPCIQSLHSFNGLRVYPAPMCSNIAVNLTLTLMGNVQLKSTTLGVVTTLGYKMNLHIQTGIIST